MSQVSMPCSVVVPISLYRTRTQLHYMLLNYKDGKFPQRSEQSSVRIAAILAYFLSLHGDCIDEATGRSWDVITTVPSSQDRIGEHPLVRSLSRVRALGDQYQQLLIKGGAPVDHLNASDDGYRCTRALRGEQILLVDDTFTSGARAQSAASALSLAGGDVVAILPVGRVISPDFNDANKEFWDRQRAIPFDFDVCCLDTHAQDEEPW